MLDAFAREPNGGLIVLPDVTTMNHREAIIALAARHRLPAIYPFRYFAASGGLMSYGTDFAPTFFDARPPISTVSSRAPVRASCRCRRRLGFVVMNLKSSEVLGVHLPPLSARSRR